MGRLEELKKLLGYEEPEYLQPYRQVYCYQFLVDVEIHKSNLDILEHVYLKGFIPLSTQGWYVIHGHTSSEGCSAPTLCHLYGYWPGEEFNPRFRKQFNLKWKTIYEQRGWKR